ncbi:hypothetical protein D3C78_1258810 [compost metagenome]
MSYGNVAGAGSYGNTAGAGSYGNGGGYSPVCGGFTSLGVILVLFILLVIISRAWFF